MIHEVRDIDEGHTWHLKAPYTFDQHVEALQELFRCIFEGTSLRVLSKEEARKVRDTESLLDIIRPSTFVQVENERFVLDQEKWEGMTDALLSAFVEEWSASRVVQEEYGQMRVLIEAGERKWR